MLVASTPFRPRTGRSKASQLFRSNRQDHSFLSFADPDLSIGQPGIFEWAPFRATPPPPSRLTHFSNGTAEKPPAPQSVIAVVKPLVTRLRDITSITIFLGDGISDLNRLHRENRFALMRQFRGRERCTVNAVASGTPTHCHNQVTGMKGFLIAFLSRPGSSPLLPQYTSGFPR